MTDGVQIIGLDTLLKRFEQMPAKVQEGLVKQGLRRGLGVVQESVRNNAPYKRGYLKKSIRVKVSKGSSRRPGPYGEVRIHAFYAKYIEFGTDPHWIQASAAQLRADSELRNAFTPAQITALVNAGARALRFGDYFGVRVWHPGIKGRGFMRRSWDESKELAIEEIKRSIRNSILYTRGPDS